MVYPTNGVTVSSRDKRQRTKGEALVELTRRGVVAPGGAAEFTMLCDVAEVEHVCELLRAAFSEGRVGVISDLPDGIERLLTEPLRRYADSLEVLTDKEQERVRRGLAAGRRMEAMPTAELLEAIEDVRTRVQFGPWDYTSEEQAVGMLSGAWFKWIAYAASYWMWKRMPELLAQPQISRELGRMGGQAHKNGVQRSSNRKAEILKQHAALLSAGKGPRGLAKIIGADLGVDASWVRKVVSEARSPQRDRAQVAEEMRRKASL